jgi:hypothetical protein
LRQVGSLEHAGRDRPIAWAAQRRARNEEIEVGVMVKAAPMRFWRSIFAPQEALERTLPSDFRRGVGWVNAHDV